MIATDFGEKRGLRFLKIMAPAYFWTEDSISPGRLLSAFV
jgi:hypothetical protein